MEFARWPEPEVQSLATPPQWTALHSRCEHRCEIPSEVYSSVYYNAILWQIHQNPQNEIADYFPCVS
jgi:hypothetical protein